MAEGGAGPPAGRRGGGGDRVGRARRPAERRWAPWWWRCAPRRGRGRAPSTCPPTGSGPGRSPRPPLCRRCAGPDRGVVVMRLFLAIPLHRGGPPRHRPPPQGPPRPLPLPGRPVRPELGTSPCASWARWRIWGRPPRARVDSTPTVGGGLRLRWGGLGAFPRARRANVLWLGVEQGETERGPGGGGRRGGGGGRVPARGPAVPLPPDAEPDPPPRTSRSWWVAPPPSGSRWRSTGWRCTRAGWGAAGRRIGSSRRSPWPGGEVLAPNRCSIYRCAWHRIAFV